MLLPCRQESPRSGSNARVFVQTRDSMFLSGASATINDCVSTEEAGHAMWMVNNSLCLSNCSMHLRSSTLVLRGV